MENNISQRPIAFRFWNGKRFKSDGFFVQDGKVYEFTDGCDGDARYLNGVLQQYTGLKDTNGNKIFEGDIVKCSYRTEEVFEITFGNGGFRLNGVTHIGVLNKTEITVIGNIFETPELLK
jgi:uncharacterized phage protein (TIGR01671 family)